MAFPEPDTRFRYARGTLFGLVGVYVMVVCGAARGDESTRLAEIRERSVYCARLVQSMQFSFEVESDDGWRSNADFFAQDSSFRVNRTDVTGLLVGKTRFKPTSFISAFNGDRRQLYHGARSLLRIKDGVERARYGISTPQTVLYGWLSTPDGAVRWDQVQDSSVWKTTFTDALYVGETTEKDIHLETVEIPFPGKTACVIRVYFASQLGYLPIKYERLIKGSLKLASWARVDEYKVLDLDGHRLAFPLTVRNASTGIENGIRKRMTTLRVDPNSLKINININKNMFTIQTSIAKTVTDADLVKRRIKEKEALHSAPGDKVGARRGSGFLLVWANVFVAALIVVGRLRRRKLKDRDS